MRSLRACARLWHVFGEQNAEPRRLHQEWQCAGVDEWLGQTLKDDGRDGRQGCTAGNFPYCMNLSSQKSVNYLNTRARGKVTFKRLRKSPVFHQGSGWSFLLQALRDVWRSFKSEQKSSVVWQAANSWSLCPSPNFDCHQKEEPASKLFPTSTPARGCANAWGSWENAPLSCIMKTKTNQ